MVDCYVGMGISGSANLVGTNLRLYPLSILMFLCGSHGIPLISIIGAIDPTMPTEHPAWAYLGTGSGKSLAKRHAVVDSSYFQTILQCVAGLSWFWYCYIFRLVIGFFLAVQILSNNLACIQQACTHQNTRYST